jgi:hypothetical protein
MNSARCENSRHFRNRALEYLKDITGKFETNAIIIILETCIETKINMTRLANILLREDRRGGLLEDSHIILNS